MDDAAPINTQSVKDALTTDRKSVHMPRVEVIKRGERRRVWPVGYPVSAFLRFSPGCPRSGSFNPEMFLESLPERVGITLELGELF